MFPENPDRVEPMQQTALGDATREEHPNKLFRPDEYFTQAIP
jgi:hypothetical protein